MPKRVSYFVITVQCKIKDLTQTFLTHCFIDDKEWMPKISRKWITKLGAVLRPCCIIVSVY